ncbi:spore germination protein [Bacillus tuaregi]|uniref:spore germination protein n=1 Tax=Bacillus tuaregi TaxID=1816695 RepID=UPI000A012865|nr:spore germination protein [Bacillus tuaregi]
MRTRKVYPIRRKKSQIQKNEESQSNQSIENSDKDPNVKQLSSDLEENLSYFNTTTGNSSDITLRKFPLVEQEGQTVCLIYADGLSNSAFIQEFILESLMVDIQKIHVGTRNQNENVFRTIKARGMPVADLKEFTDFETLFSTVLSGDTVLLMNGVSKGLALNSRGWEKRSVAEPTSQTVVRGPKDCFTETLRTNTALIRRRIKDKNLRVDSMKLGTRTQTDISIMYIAGIATDDIVAEVKSRLKRIRIDGILESGHIEEFIQDARYSPFPTVMNTERPDSVAAALLEGRIALVIDGTPFVLVVPSLFIHFFQSSEDYYQRADISTFIRLLRYLAFFLALLTPSAYIAVTTFHQEMLPSEMLISLAAQREGVPLPALVEAIMMEITFEILREAGIRMPRAVGSAISIVGALVIGQAAVEAGIVSASMVIVVALTAISSFVSPSFNMSISTRLLRFPLMLLAASFGLFGILLGLIVMVLHMSSIRSFGIPYLAPNAPFNLQDQKDNFVRAPRWLLRTRPRLISPNNITRSTTPPPKPPK